MPVTPPQSGKTLDFLAFLPVSGRRDAASTGASRRESGSSMRLGMAPARLARKFVSILLAYLLVGSGLLGALPAAHGPDAVLQICARTGESSAPKGQPDAPPAHSAQDCCLAACLGPVADLGSAPVVIAPIGHDLDLALQSCLLLFVAAPASSKLARAPPVG
jgi:hypothetical protein